MKKISNLLIMALLTVGMGLTSCDEQLDNAVTPYTPGVTPGTDEGEVTVAATAAKTFAEATAGDIGKIVGKDGKIYATKADAEAVATGNAVAMIAYMGSSTGDATYNHGLALALTDESSSGMAWEAAKTACSDKNTSAAVTSALWMLPSKDQWNKMIDAAGGYVALHYGFGDIEGASNLDYKYWSSTANEETPALAWTFFFGSGEWTSGTHKYDIDCRVRACLAF